MLGALRPSSKQPAFVVPKDYEKLALNSPYLTRGDATVPSAVDFVFAGMKHFVELTKEQKSDQILKKNLNLKDIQLLSQLSPENQALIALCVMLAASKLTSDERKRLFDIEKVKKVEESKLSLGAAYGLLERIDAKIEKKAKEIAQLRIDLKEALIKIDKTTKGFLGRIGVTKEEIDPIGAFLKGDSGTPEIIERCKWILEQARSLIAHLASASPVPQAPIASKITPSATPMNSRLPTPAPKQPIGQPVEMEDASVVYRGMRYSVKDLDLSTAHKRNTDMGIHGKGMSNQIIGLLLRDGTEVWVADFAFGVTMLRDILSGQKQIHTMKGIQNITQMPKDLYVVDKALIVKMAGWSTQKK